MIFVLMLLTLLAGTVIPIQTSINTRLRQYTQSAFYASTVSFFTGTCVLAIIIILSQPQYFSLNIFNSYTLDYRWIIGGLMGVIFLTGNLLLLPRIGASLTVITTLSGQMMMGVIIDTFGLFQMPVQTITVLKIAGFFILILGILLMNYQPKSTVDTRQKNVIWMLVGIVFGFAPPIQTAINSSLGQLTHSSLFAAFVSFLVGTFTLMLLTLIVHRRFKIITHHDTYGPLRTWHFIGGPLGVLFVTTNIIVAPLLGITVTLIIVMLGQIVMGLCIDHFGWMGMTKRSIDRQRLLGLLCIITAIILIQFH